MKHLLTIAVLTLLITFQLNAQVSIFAEDFETASGSENLASPYLGWQNGQFATTPPTNNNYFWVFDNTRSTVINGTHSMAVSINNPSATAPFPEYRTTRVASTFAYNTTPIDATNFTNLTLDFNWICEGETNFDYGTVLYSLDANTWSTLPGTYQNQSTVQNVTNLDLSILDGQIFYIAFGWDNDNSFGTFPGFIIDDIDIKGTPLTACTMPTNQPTVLNLTPTNNTILGTFTAASPIPDNYLVLISTSAVAPAPVNGVAYNIGDSIGTSTVVDIDANTTFTATGLSVSTPYYIYIYSFNSLCSGGPIYNSTSPLSGTTTTTNSIYCTPLTQNTPSLLYIDDVQFLGTLNDINNLTNGFSSSPSGFQDFTTSVPNSIQAQGQGINIYVGSNTARGHYKAWVDWDNNGTFGNNINELVYDSGGVLTATTTFGFVIPTNQTIGDYRIRIRFNNAYRNNTGAELGSYNYTACEPFIFHNFPGPNNDYTDYGEAEDYLFTVVESCSAQITSITEAYSCGPGTALLQVTGNVSSSGFNWYANETGGTPIATTATFSPVISATTTYWVTATSGVCESLKRIPITATLNPITELTIIPETPIICGNSDVIEISATGSTELAYLVNEDFETGGTGVFSSVNIFSNGATQDALTEWQNRSSTFVPNQQVWFPAISSGFGANQFVMATSDINPIGTVWASLESPILDSSTFTDLTLNFDMYFSKYSAASSPDDIYIFISTDGGANYNILQNISADVGIGTNFGNVNIDLTAYINEPNLIITIDYIADWMDGVAIDNVKVFGSRPLNPSFTWTGTVDAYLDAATTIPYTAGTPASTVFVKPTLAQLALGDFSFTANGTLSNGCTISKDIIITNNSKIWNGSISNDWNTAANWTPSGAPDNSKCIYIPNTSMDPIMTGTTNGEGLRMTIANGGLLTQSSNSTLTITENINVNTGGIYNLEDSASLIQVDNTINIVDGTFTIQRIANLRQNDYVYWSSPVANFPIQNVSPGTIGYKYEWLPTVNQGPGPPGIPMMLFGDWQSANTGAMNAGKGYAIRGPSGHPSTPSPFTALFSGTPNNGSITRAIERGTFTNVTPYYYQPNPGGALLEVTKDDDNWNFIGNPYPSALNAFEFLNNPTNSNIDGAVYIWTHGTDIAIGNGDSFYDEYTYTYSDLDYLTVNATGNALPNPYKGYIASGQGFFVLMNDTGSTSENVYFENNMRGSDHRNDQFFRSTNVSGENTETKHRIWLDYINPIGETNTTLVGYVNGATNDIDRMYDAKTTKGNGLNLYSIINNGTYIIQGRQLPFMDTDTVPLGLNITEAGIQTIAINTLEGLFKDSDQNIYIEDLETEIIHNLTNAPYSFTSEIGVINDRFVLRYRTESLSIDDVDILNGIKVFEDNETLVINSNLAIIQSIEVYDMLGRTLFSNFSININRFTINSISPMDSALLVKITLVDGRQKIAKVIF